MLFIDLHSHVDLMPFPLPSFLERQGGQQIKIESIYNYLKKENGQAIISVTFYNVLGFHYGMNGVYDQYKKLQKGLRELGDEVLIIKSKEDLKKDFRLGIVLQLESCSWMKPDNFERNLKELYKLGVRGIIPIHFRDNFIGKSCDYPHLPLNDKYDFGLNENDAKNFFEVCKDLKIWLDMSHMSERAVEETFKFSHHKLCVTHTGIMEIQKSKRSLTTEVSKKINKLSGIVGLCPYSKFCKTKEKFIRMIQVFIDESMENNMALGSDYGAPIFTDPALCNYEQIINTIQKSDLSKDIQDKFLWKNALTFLESALV